MAEKAEFQKPPALTPVFTAVHFGAGAERGIISLGVPIFQEMVTGLPISKLANHLSGISIGSATASILSIPRYENSDIPRFSALDAEEGIKQIIRIAAPHRTAYMIRRTLPNILQFMHEAQKVSADIIARKTDGGVTLAVHAIARRYHELMNSSSKYAYTEYRPCQSVIKNVFKPVNRLIDSWLNTMMKNARYDIHIPHQAFDLAFRTEDTNRQLGLKDSITGLHISAFNYTRDEPAHFSHYRDMDGVSQDVSDPDMMLDDIAAGSCAAPAYFDYHIARNGEYYLDVGHLDNTAFNAINSVQSHVGDDIPIHCISLGTGIEERVMDGKKINNPLHLILDAGQRYFEKRDTKILNKNLHNGTLHHFDIPLSAPQKKYADNPKLVRAAAILGFNLLARDEDDEVNRVPTSSSFGNTTNDGLGRLSEYKWDLLWHNFDAVVERTKFMVQNCALQNKITQQQADHIIEDLEWLYPRGASVPDPDYVPHRPFPNIRAAKSDICFELSQPYSWKKYLAGIFNKKAVAPQKGDNHEFFVGIIRHPANDSTCDNHDKSCPKKKNGTDDPSP
jgi:hypothetical protein